MTACERDGCGHPLGRHMACGPCIIEGCDCTGFHLATAAERKAREVTRCSGCKRRVHAGGPHGSALALHGTPLIGVPCPRKGMGPDRAESWKP